MDEQTQPMREAARGALKEVAEQATQRADAAVGTMAEEGRALANALRSAADQAERDGARMVHGPLRSAAALFERWVDQTQNAGPQQLFSSLESFGRREPMALFGLAAAAGFIGTRALRAGAQTRAGAAPQAQRSDEGTGMTMAFEHEGTSAPTREATQGSEG